MSFSLSLHGASENPQLPITTLVMAVPAGTRPERVPGDLGVHMGMSIDKAGGDDVAFGVDRLLRAVTNAANRSDFPIHYPHIGNGIGACPSHQRRFHF